MCNELFIWNNAQQERLPNAGAGSRPRESKREERRIEETRRPEKESLLSAPAWGREELVEEGAGHSHPISGSNSHRTFLRSKGKRNQEKTHNKGKEKQRMGGGKGRYVPSGAEGSGKVHGCKGKGGREKVRDKLCYHKPRGTAGVMWTLQLDREPREIIGQVPLLCVSDWSLGKKLPPLRNLLQAALSQTPPAIEIV